MSLRRIKLHVKKFFPNVLANIIASFTMKTKGEVFEELFYQSGQIHTFKLWRNHWSCRCTGQLWRHWLLRIYFVGDQTVHIQIAPIDDPDNKQ